MKALVLAGGFPQIALIEELKSRNIYVVLADWNEEPVAKNFADKFYQVSTLDVDAIKNVAVTEKVDFLITVCTDQALLTVAKVSDDLGLPCYIDYQTALNVTNKKYMKEVFADKDIPTAKHIITDTVNDNTLNGLKYPLIVKPVDCNSSKGVIKVQNKEELMFAFNNAKQMSRTNTAIIEEFIDGEELTVDAYVEDGVAEVLSVSVSEKIKDKEKFVIFRTVNPAPISEKVYNEIKKTVQKIVDAFNLYNTPMLIQMLSDGESAYVIEFSARTGGGVKYLLIKRASGFDVIKAVVDLTLGKKPHVKKMQRKNVYIVNEFIYCYPGRFDRLEGFSELKNNGIISDYYLFKWKGAEFDSVSNSGDRVAGFTIEGNSIDEIKRKHSITNESIKVISLNGNDIMRHDLLTDISL